MINYSDVTSQMIKTMCANDGSQEETIRASHACYWLSTNLNNLRRYTCINEAAIIGVIYRVYFDSMTLDNFDPKFIGTTIGYKGLKDELMSIKGSEALIMRVDEIIEDDNEIVPTCELTRLLNNLVTWSEEIKIDNFAKTLRKIIGPTGWEDDSDRLKPHLQGPKDAMKYIYSQLDKGLTSRELPKDISCVINEDIFTLINDYHDRVNKPNTIPTGIQQIDNVLQIQRGHLVGILGYNKHRKTTLCRSIAYNAIRNGFNVLHLTWEQTYKEELAAYQLMHTVVGRYSVTASVDKLNRNTLSKNEVEAIRLAGRDLAHLSGTLKVIEPASRSWENLKTRIEHEMLDTKYDIVLIDYLALASSNSNNRREAMDEIIRDAKQFAKTINACILTPIQGNREGVIRAQENEGRWEKEGVESYSEFNKSCNSILSVFYDTEDRKNREIIINLLLSRSSGAMDGFKATVNDNAGYIYSTIETIQNSDTIEDGF